MDTKKLDCNKHTVKEVMRVNLKDNCFTATDWTLCNFSVTFCLGESDEN